MWPFRKQEPCPQCPAPYDPVVAPVSIDFARAMREVVAIEYDVFERPWEHEDFANFINHAGVIQFRWQDDHIIGFMCIMKVKHGYEIENLGVRRDKWRMGVARTMIEALRRNLSVGQRIIASVSDKNLDAHKFFRAMGFIAVKVKRNAFTDSSDAYVFSWMKPATENDCGGREQICGEAKA